MDWDEMMEEQDKDTDDIDKGVVGVVDLTKVGVGGGVEGDVESGVGELLGKILMKGVEEKEDGEEEECRYAGKSDKEIVKELIKPIGIKRSSEEVVSTFKSRFDKNFEWVPHESLFALNLPEHRRSRVWIIKGLVLIRDDGRCRICGERVRGNTWKVLLESKELGWSEDNCFLVCGDCALCHMYKESGQTDRLKRFKGMKVFVLNRRLKRVGRCGKLREAGMTALVLLQRELGSSKGKIDCRLVKREVLRKQESRDRLVFGEC